MVVTDPPYGIGWSRGENVRRRASHAHAGILNDHDTSARDAALALVADIPAVVFGSFYAPHPPDTKQVLVWPKPLDSGVVGSVTGYRRDAEPVFLVGPWPTRSVEWSSVLPMGSRGIAAVTAASGHPHAKPVPLLRTLIERSTRRGGLVLDPFMGSGSTLRAAKDLGRRAVGIELEERYCEIAARRMCQEVLDLGSAA